MFRFAPVDVGRLIALLVTKLFTTNKRFAVATTCACTPTKGVSVFSCSRVVFTAVLKFILFKRVPSGCDFAKCILVVLTSLNAFLCGVEMTGTNG